MWPVAEKKQKPTGASGSFPPERKGIGWWSGTPAERQGSGVVGGIGTEDFQLLLVASNFTDLRILGDESIA